MKLNVLNLSRTLGILSTLVLFQPAALIAQQFQQTNLVSDTVMEGTNPPDPDLKNAWGISRGSISPFWVSDNRTGVSTLYNGSGVKNPLTVTIPHKVIVGQFGSGEILAFDAITGQFEGKFNDQNNKVITIDGLWALEFGDGLPTSDPPNQPDNALFFSAGPNKGNNGLFGTLTPVAAELTGGSDQ